MKGGCKISPIDWNIVMKMMQLYVELAISFIMKMVSLEDGLWQIGIRARLQYLDLVGEG